MHNFGSASPGGTASERTRSQTVWRSGPQFSKSVFWYSAGVFRDTPHESFRNTNQALPPHCNHPLSTGSVLNSCLLCGSSEVGFRQDVARTNVCIIPGTNFCSLGKACTGLLFPVTIASISLRNAEPLAPPLSFHWSTTSTCRDEVLWCGVALKFHMGTSLHDTSCNSKVHL